MAIVVTDIPAHVGDTAKTISPLLPKKFSKPKSIIDELSVWSWEAPPAPKLSAGGASKFIQILLQIPLSEIEIGSNSVNFG